ncbi:MFS transporter [Alicyclobacillus cycloheptanicus]|nr:MFS transporter [Alicyclobacillus cycloheptanicus]
MAFAAWLMGGVSDRLGRKKVLVPSAIFFSLMSWVTGVARSYGGLLAVRALLGLGEGGVFSSSVATLAEESTPSRNGFNLGAHQAVFPLLGIGLGAIIATQLEQVVGWRPVFFIVGIPGLILSIILAFVMKGSQQKRQIAKEEAPEEPVVTEKSKPHIFAALKYHNVVLSSLISILYMNWLFVFSAFATLFLTEVRHLSLSQAGVVISAWGFGGFVGMLLVPALSDYMGRKPAMLVFTVLNGLFTLWFALAGTNQTLLFVILLFGGIFGWGCYPVYLSLCTTESVPRELSGSAVGIPTAVGEIFGAVLMPVIAGALADKFGLSYPMFLAAAAPIIAGVVALFYIETAPKVLARKAAQEAVDVSTVLAE